MEWKNRKTHWHEAVSSALNFPFLKEVSQNCFVLNVVNFENSGRLAEVFRFSCCQLQKLRTSCTVVSFLTLATSKIEEGSQNLFVFDVVNFGKLRNSRRIVSFLMLSSFKIEEGSQTCFVFDVVKFNWTTDGPRA